MMRQLTLVAAAGLLGVEARADTLEHRDGAIAAGTYVGGDEGSVYWATEGQTLVIPRDQILAITFDGQALPPMTSGLAASKRSFDRTVPTGTRLHVRLTRGITTRRATPGMGFEGVLNTPLQVGPDVRLPEGTRVFGKTTATTRSGHVLRKAELGIVITSMMVGKRRVPVSTDEARFTGRSQGTLAKVGVSTAVGAAFNGRKGAKRGAAVGGVIALLSAGKQVNIEAGTLLTFTTVAPFELP